MKKIIITLATVLLLTGQTMAMGSRNDQAARGTTTEESDSVGRGNSPSNITGSTTQDADPNKLNSATTDETTDESMTKDIEARKNEQDTSRRTSRNKTASGTTTIPKSTY